jgi:hypoxia-inducible factor (prolyl hydroxylase)
VVYLNPEWRESYGGACRVTVKPNDRYIQEQKQPEIAKHVVDVYPEAGRLLFFDSAKIAHEVMPTYADRHAITIWYYDTEERKEAIARAREAARQNNPDSSNNRGKNNPIAQQDAKNFIAELMGGDEVAADGGDPTEETLVPLRNKVKSMSSEVVNIIAGVTGAPSEASFREGFELLTPTDLKAMRQLFRRMGLQ